jgi:hypothetical protein
MILILSVLIILPSIIKSESNVSETFFVTFFLILSLFYWVSLEKIRTHVYSFKLIASFISVLFSAVVSGRLFTLITDVWLIKKQMLFWAYYIIFSVVLYLSLSVIKDETNKSKKRLSQWGKFLAFVAFAIGVYVLSMVLN